MGRLARSSTLNYPLISRIILELRFTVMPTEVGTHDRFRKVRCLLRTPDVPHHFVALKFAVDPGLCRDDGEAEGERGLRGEDGEARGLLAFAGLMLLAVPQILVDEMRNEFPKL
jgi:hypothetical protein